MRSTDALVHEPEIGQSISSPLEIAGTAPGTWFFEGRIRLQLQTLDGSVIAEKSVTTTDNWMTEAPVAFNTTLNFDTPDAKYGVVIIEKANASGRPNQAASYAVPVKFQ